MEPVPSGTSCEEKCRRLERQMATLKQISSLRKNLLELREKQAKSLISKLKYYEVIVTGERESRHSLSSRLQQAELQCTQLTEKLIKNDHSIEEMKANYENKVSTLINELQTSEQRNTQLAEQLSKGCSIEELVRRLDEKDKLVAEMQRQMKRVWERNKVLSYQMSLLNNLFNETEGVTIDFEKIKAIGDIVRESQTYTSDSEDVLSDDQDTENRQSVDIENLLDSMEKSEDVVPAEIPGEESCYKSVDTKRGPQLVLSVSRTFIKLKDLIVEKKSLQKEIDTLKALNTKLETKVDKQEHRLYRVTMELNKTWSLVSKLKQQHKRLYNSEAVLRYELQEKRTLLERLKNELSVSRDKWRRVRQKNSQSQIEWEKLRDEFAQRKHQSSQESGTFSEVMSISSGENDATLEEDDGASQVVQDIAASRRESRPRKLSISSNNETNQTEVTTPETPQEGIGVEDETEEHPQDEEDYEDGARALSPSEDETFSDPLEELVSNLVEDIDNEADTEEDNNGEQSCASPPPNVDNDSSPSPDFEGKWLTVDMNPIAQNPSRIADRMRRRANRLRMLEEQCVLLHQKLQASTARSEALSTKLADLHDHYGPSDGSTSTPSDEHPQCCDEVSNVQDKEEAETKAAVGVTANDEETASISTDGAYVSGTENNGTPSVSGMGDEAKPEPDTQREASVPSSESNENTNDSERFPCQESSTPAAELINAFTENSLSSDEPTSRANDNNNRLEIQSLNSTQGQLEDNDCAENPRCSESALLEPPSQEVVNNDYECNQPQPITPEACTLQNSSSIIVPPESLVTLSEENRNETMVDSSRENPSTVVNEIDCFNENARLTDSSVNEDQPTSILVNLEVAPSAGVEPVAVEVEIPIPQDEEPGPIVQETVVQHFPNTNEEEANELAALQIRPEFLRILQEADEATNANSLDWMPSLLTITHSVALLRLDPELPSGATGDGGRLDGPGARSAASARSLSESLRIEIPGQSPSPPMHPRRHNDRRETHHNSLVDQDHGGGDERVATYGESSSNGESAEGGVMRKDPSFLSRMIIKQLPKRLQLLKNENHTLQMETAEANMRMKEMKRQLTKEQDKQQQMSMSLDAQIEEKNLIEFELREEIERKEKVIEDLQIEIDQTKEYAEELRKEKEGNDATFKALVEEKRDMEDEEVVPSTVHNCHNCKRPFSLLTRRKCHCKICGKVFCKDCAILREPNRRSQKRPRLCTRCHLRRQRLVALVVASHRSPSTDTNN